MKLIYNMDNKNLVKLKIKKFNLNFCVSFPQVEIDQKIAPVHLAAFIGK